MESSSDSKRIDRVVLACVQCRSRHVKCDSTQPVCSRCRRDGKECVYQKSRRGGLNKAALAERRLRLQQEARNPQRSATQRDDCFSEEHKTSAISSSDQSSLGTPTSSSADDSISVVPSQNQHNHVAFKVDKNRLLELYFEYFWPPFPIVLPLHYLQSRRLQDNHGITTLLSVLEWIGSIYAPWTPSEPYYMTALEAITSPNLTRTPFNVQALMLFALAEFHCDNRVEARKKLSTCTAMALELHMNERDFARAYGENDSVLEECWRRTYYILYIVDQHLAVVTNTPFYSLLLIPNTVDLPCDDECFESGNIPPIATWSEYQVREFAEIEVIYSSIVYLYDIAMVIAFVMNTFLDTAVVNEVLVENCDTKLAIWSSLLPACKKDPLRLNGQVDEVMFMAHMCAAITISALHRPFSSLGYCPEEMTTQAFQAPSPFTLTPKAGRNAHTARVLKATEIHTNLLAIPCALEKHNVFTMCITSQLAAVQVSACTYILDGHALSIGRDRVRLSIGFVNTMATLWPLGKKMAKEVRAIARSCIAGTCTQNTVAMDAEYAGGEIDLARDELVWPVNPSAQIDIYSGIVLPIDWDATSFSYSSLMSSELV